jgi:hypothetical protein
LARNPQISHMTRNINERKVILSKFLVEAEKTNLTDLRRRQVEESIALLRSQISDGEARREKARARQAEGA